MINIQMTEFLIIHPGNVFICQAETPEWVTYMIYLLDYVYRLFNVATKFKAYTDINDG